MLLNKLEHHSVEKLKLKLTNTTDFCVIVTLGSAFSDQPKSYVMRVRAETCESEQGHNVHKGWGTKSTFTAPN